MNALNLVSANKFSLPPPRAALSPSSFVFSPFFSFEKTRFFLFPRTDKDSGQSGNLRVRQSNRATSTRLREALFPGNASQVAQHQACDPAHASERAEEREREREHARARVYL
jgi:hypothetical protein